MNNKNIPIQRSKFEFQYIPLWYVSICLHFNAVNGVANFQNPDFYSVEWETEIMNFRRRRILPQQNETAALLTCYSVF